MNTTNRNSQMRIADLLCQISNASEMVQALKCILTEKELLEIENRLRIYRLLDQKMPQREIATRLGVGIATVTRGAQSYKKGKFSVLKHYMPDSNQ